VKAIQVAAFGEPDVLQLKTVADPVPQSGQLLITVSVSDVLFVDTIIRSGRGVAYFPIRPPYVPGNGVGGTVSAVGERIDPSWLGRPVVAHTGGAGGTGGYAQLATVDLPNAVAVPEGVELDHATAVLHDGTTALRILETIGDQPDEWVLILGAAGGMGILLVQLLTARGGRVIGAAGGHAKREVVAAAGAKAAIDYHRPEWPDLVLQITGGAQPAVVLDGVGGRLGARAFELVADGGRFSAHGSASGGFAPINADQATRRGVSVTTIADLQYGLEGRSRLMRAALDELRDGAITPVVGQTFPLADAAGAHHAIEARTTVAKTLLVSQPIGRDADVPATTDPRIEPTNASD
jgi:NADPH2:quinone reductase